MAPSPDQAVGENIADAVPSSSHGKRGRGKRTTSESERAAKLPRAPVEETKAPEEDNTETPTTNVEEERDTQNTPAANTTENIVKLLSNLSSDDPAIIADSLVDLGNLCAHDLTDLSVANEREIRRLGLHTAVVQVVKKHVDDALIQEEGIGALLNFTFSTLAQVLVGDIGGVEVILAGMKRHPDNANIQWWGCGAIGNLLYETKRNAERLEESDGIAAVIAAMKVHPNNEEVQCNSCYAIWRMCEWAEYRHLIVAAGGLVTIAKAMEKYIGNPRVREESRRALQSLTKSD